MVPGMESGLGFAPSFPGPSEWVAIKTELARYTACESSDPKSKRGQRCQLIRQGPAVIELVVRLGNIRKVAGQMNRGSQHDRSIDQSRTDIHWDRV